MTDWLLAAQHASSESQRRKFMRRHQADYLRDTIRNCRECPLNRTRKNTVPFDGTPPKPIAIVGEAPGANEDKEGKPFAGRSGSMLRQMLEAVDYDRSQAVVMNVIACRPPKNRAPDIEEVEACSPHFDAQLALSGAWVVALLGQSALNRIRPGLKIGTTRGRPFWQDGRIWVPTYHPAYVLRNRNSRGLVESDLKVAFDIAYGRNWQAPTRVEPLSKPDTRSLTNSLDTQGYAVWDSARLDDTIIVIRDELIKVPTRHSHMIRYSVEELIRIGELGKGEDMSTDDLRKVHLVKSLGGTIIS